MPGPKLRAQADDGTELHVHVPQFVGWILSLCGVAVVAGVGLLINLNLRVAVLEEMAHTPSEVTASFAREYMPRFELEAHMDRLDRIESKIDRLIERQGGGG